MIRIKKITEEKEVKIIIDPYISLWLYFGANINFTKTFKISDYKKNILIIKNNIYTNEIYEICLISSNKAIFFNEISYNSTNVRKSIGLPEVYDKKNKSKYGDGIYNNFKILYTRDTIKIEFTNIVNNYSKILKKIIKNKDVFFETNKNGVILSITLTNLSNKVIENMLRVLEAEVPLEFFKKNYTEQENEYILLNDPLKKQRP